MLRNTVLDYSYFLKKLTLPDQKDNHTTIYSYRFFAHHNLVSHIHNIHNDDSQNFKLSILAT
jgi:hypothetical protein